jgi:hypothetical protein
MRETDKRGENWGESKREDRGTRIRQKEKEKKD